MQGCSLGIVVAVYVVVLSEVLLAVGPESMADSAAPLAAAVAAGRWESLTPVVRIGAAIAAAGVLLSLLAGISRTMLSMARRRELPGFLDAVHPTHRTPHRADVTAAALVCAVVLFADLGGANGFSSFAVLTYYALAGATADAGAEVEVDATPGREQAPPDAGASDAASGRGPLDWLAPVLDDMHKVPAFVESALSATTLEFSTVGSLFSELQAAGFNALATLTGDCPVMDFPWSEAGF